MTRLVLDLYKIAQLLLPDALKGLAQLVGEVIESFRNLYVREPEPAS